MGITMATAEVFWTHMERKAEPDMKPSISLETTGQEGAVRRAPSGARHREQEAAFRLACVRTHHAGLTPTKVTSLRATLR